MSHHPTTAAARVARGLGWTGIALGVAELAAPRHVQRLLGLEDRADHRGALRVLGAREIMHGVGLIGEGHSPEQLATGLWSRVAGDVLDTAMLGVAALKTKNGRRFAAVAASVLVIGLLDFVFACRLQRREDG